MIFVNNVFKICQMEEGEITSRLDILGQYIVRSYDQACHTKNGYGSVKKTGKIQRQYFGGSKFALKILDFLKSQI